MLIRPAAKNFRGDRMKGVDDRIIMFVVAIVAIVILMLIGISIAQTGQGLSNPILDLIKGLFSSLTGKTS